MTMTMTMIYDDDSDDDDGDGDSALWTRLTGFGRLPHQCRPRQGLPQNLAPNAVGALACWQTILLAAAAVLVSAASPVLVTPSLRLGVAQSDPRNTDFQPAP